MLRCLARNQEALGDMDFLFLGVAGKLDDFHAIAQRLRNRIHPVGRGDEDDLREIERNVEIMIAERRILFRIEHFHQRRRWIAAEIAAELVHFVEHEHWVHRLGATNVLNHLPGQSANVSPAMAADFSFVVHAAKRDADKFPAHSSRDGFSERCLADAWRPDEAKNRTFHSRLKLFHREIVENALLHLFEIVVIFVEDRLGLRDVNVFRAGGLVPRQRGHPFEVRPRDHVLG